ncbi:15045_t:CDS:2 [Funneliformis mosseae]|uniref:15045_t:CDS:1 n=1 Tax=Funneliformis mosseae TaxID=27381 RepID=A0A9N9E8G7_FUNMO|nr:15045_t:CDS:2 [Funneliformis mosseae]
MSTSQSTQSNQDPATTSFTSTFYIFETGEMKRYRKYWWKTGKIHSKARWEEAILLLGYLMILMSNIRINIIFTAGGSGKMGPSVSLSYPQNFTSVVLDEVAIATRNVMSTNVGILNDGSTTTKTPSTGKEADGSWTPVAKPRLISGGSDESGTQPWPNLVVEVAYKQSEADVKTKVETYWTQGGRAHDAIAIKIEEPVAPATRPSVMTAWHYCTNNRTATGELNPTMYEFGTIDRSGNQINLVPSNVTNPPPPPTPQLPPPNLFATLPNPISIDMFHAQFAILNN